MKTRTCLIITAVAVFVIALILLEFEYPWSTYSAFHFSKWQILISYLMAAFMVAAMAAVATVLCLRLVRESLLLKAVMCCMAMFVSLSVIAVVFGPGGYEVPGTLMGGLFFSEWEFLNFIFKVATPASVITAALCAWLAHKQSNINAQSMN